jgi:cell division transport system permease protein
LRTRFILSEMAIGLRRNLSMTIALVLTVAISLALLGAALLASRQIDTMKDFWFDKIEVSVFLDEGVTQAQRDAVRAELDRLPEVEQVYYESKEQAYIHAQKLFAGQEALQSIIKPDNLPESYRVKLYNPERYEVVGSAVGGLPGVDRVLGRSKQLENFFRFLSYGQKIGLGAAIVALLAAVLLIFNTVRLAAFSRRRETGIMRLVGASNFYIQLPFLLEGAIAGFAGGLIASGFIVATRFTLLTRIEEWFQFDVALGTGALMYVIGVSMILGVLLCAVTSFLTLRRYLKV